MHPRPVYALWMALYHFQISRNRQPVSVGQQIDVPDNRAAWLEAATICRDLSRDIIDEFDVYPEWQMDVMDATGSPLYRFRFIAESL